MPQVADLKDIRAQTQGFGDGINIQDAPNMLGPNECRRAENGVLDERGGFTKRSGCSNQGPVGVGADRIISCYTYNRGGATKPSSALRQKASAAAESCRASQSMYSR